MAGELILVVDDGRENCEFVVDYILRPNGFRTAVAYDGQTGLDKALSEAPDLILLDLQMPRMDGIQVLEALRERQSSIPVILMTFHGSEEIAIKVFRMGVRDYVMKPFTVDEMLDAIERALSETRLRREKEALTERLLKSNREMQRRIKELNALYGISKSVTALLEVDQLLTRVVDAAIYVSGAEQGALMLLNDGELWKRAVRARGDPAARPVNLKASERLAYRAVQTGKPVMLTPGDTAGLEDIKGLPKAVLYTPLKLSDTIIGVLGVDNFDVRRPFTEHDSTLLSVLSDYAAIALQNARLYTELKEAKEREKQAIRGAFERYVSPSVVDRVLEKPESATLGGDRYTISILFADIRGYTTFTEYTEPEIVVEALNEYFSMAGEIIVARQGTLDKFMGDAVMAFFNAPDPQPDHVFRAVDAAVALQRAVEERNARVKGDMRLQFGIGVSVGEAVVGNIGTPQQMNFTAIGDTVNLAKRLQERANPGQILVAEEVVAALGDRIRVEPLGLMRLKGRQKRAAVYELKGLIG